MITNVYFIKDYKICLGYVNNTNIVSALEDNLVYVYCFDDNTLAIDTSFEYEAYINFWRMDTYKIVEHRSNLHYSYVEALVKLIKMQQELLEGAFAWQYRQLIEDIRSSDKIVSSIDVQKDFKNYLETASIDKMFLNKLKVSYELINGDLYKINF